MSDVLPKPLVPVEVDLRGLEWMPLLGDRLFGSATWIAASAEAKVAALRLWWRAYAHEVPAASLPDEDALLADYAGYGVAVKAWCKLRPQALRGWVKCSDGRLYHPLLATLVMDAWQQRLRAREKQARYRGRNRPVDGNKAGDVTVTQPARYRGGHRDVTPDLDLTGPDLTEDLKPPPAAQSPAPPPADMRSVTAAPLAEGQAIRVNGSHGPPQHRGTRLPEDWIPGPEGVAFADEHGLGDRVLDLVDQFRDHWRAQPGQRGVKVDWQATWRNWLRRERGYVEP